ncbi:MAG: hypothetical protein IJV65_02060, partial [Kiritimatiellae bacterium]|nr:hypothetical protein [Kiritimatiellia bacterium]
RTALAAACGAAILLALAAAWLHPAARRALAADRDGVLFALPALAAAVALALAWRRPAACLLLAAGALACLPYFVVQGQEVQVGAWSLRRSLAPLVLFFLAAFFAAFETTGREALDPVPFRRRPRLRAALLLLAALGTIAAPAFRPFALPDGDEPHAGLKLWQVENEMEPDGLYLFDHFPFAAPFAGAHPERAIFGINEGVAKALRHDRVVGWLRAECGKRPTYVVAGSRDADAGAFDDRDSATTVLEDRLALQNEEDKRVRGRAAAPLAFRFLRARPPRRGDGTTIEFSHSPFGLAGGWDELRPGKKGRWARQGATFWGPVPEPGGSVELEIETVWTPPAGADWPEQTLRVIPPWDNAPVDAAVRADAGRHVIRVRAERPAGDSADLPPSALWRLSTDRPYDPAAHGIRGYPPDLVVPVYRIRARPSSPARDARDSKAAGAKIAFDFGGRIW